MIGETDHKATLATNKWDLYRFLVRGSELRPTRFHDEKGTLAIRSLRDVGDCAYAFITAIVRKTVGWRAPVPWIALSALRHVKKSLSQDAAIFEWGCGMSTLWYDRNYREVHSVEDNPTWYQNMSSRTKSARVYFLENEAYVKKFSSFPAGYFDLVVIDGSHRLRCFNEVMRDFSPIKAGGIIVIDNSDKDRTTYGDLWLIDQALAADNTLDVKRFTGWSPGNFFPQETTVVQRRGAVPRLSIHENELVSAKTKALG
jgi:hypothetical protein